ncbi:MAG: DEAD/DEAH box helicase [Rhodospirillales bacterium]|nr:DEAD/DEAH box helicase [Rhodospirillales bacterium]
MSFSDLGLSPDLLRAIEDAGYVNPTPIQEQAIPPALTGRDVLGCAQTGTGKTASFTLPMIEALSAGRAKARMPRSLILTPTRELATQISENFEIYGKYHKLSMALLIGGVSMGAQVKKLDRGVDVLIATPGRLLDHFERGRILMSDIKILVIDEADRMLDMGFIPDVEKIVAMLPPIRNTLFFSATMPPEIRRLADKFLMNPKEIHVDPPATMAETITQGLVVVKHGDGRRPGGGQAEKRDALRQLLRTEKPSNALIFCNRKRDVDTVYRSLTRHGLPASRLHGDMSQPERTATLGKFKTGDIKLLVCSDVAARGLDIPEMSHVFNFDVPTHAEDYVHRIGRTGRAGHQGRAITIATPEDGKYLEAIEELTGRKIPRMELGGQASAELKQTDPSDKPSPRRGGRDRGRGTDRGRKPSPQTGTKPEPKPSPQVEAKPEAPPEPKVETKAPEKAPEPAPRKAPEPAPKKATPANESQAPVKGLGEHVPAFMRTVPPKSKPD